MYSVLDKYLLFSEQSQWSGTILPLLDKHGVIFVLLNYTFLTEQKYFIKIWIVIMVIYLLRDAVSLFSLLLGTDLRTDLETDYLIKYKKRKKFKAAKIFFKILMKSREYQFTSIQSEFYLSKNQFKTKVRFSPKYLVCQKQKETGKPGSQSFVH